MKDPQFAKAVVFINAIVPLSLLTWDAYSHHLGANPAEFSLRTTGLLALIFLLLSLMVTPARKFTGWNGFSHFRRELGLFAYFYGVIHLGLYVVLDRSLDFESVFEDVVKRPFILLGMTALLLMTPLALTSTNKMIKRLGAPRWKRLHQLVYPAAIAAAIHYLLVGKILLPQPLIFATLFAILLLYRVILSLRKPDAGI